MQKPWPLGRYGCIRFYVTVSASSTSALVVILADGLLYVILSLSTKNGKQLILLLFSHFFVFSCSFVDIFIGHLDELRHKLEAKKAENYCWTLDVLHFLANVEKMTISRLILDILQKWRKNGHGLVVLILVYFYEMLLKIENFENLLILKARKRKNSKIRTFP